MKKIIIKACTDLGTHVDGSRLAPEILINKEMVSSTDKIIKLSTDKNYIKNKDNSELRKNEQEIIKFNNKMYHEICKYITKGYFPVSVGGDHSIAISSALASRKNKNIGIIWFDAHADFNTFETTLTGNIHGLPLATITGFGNETLSSFYKDDFINTKNVVIVGARSIDKLELENLKQAGIKIFSTKDIKTFGIDYVVNKAIEIACNGTDGYHISYDIDALDPLIAPGVSIPEENGVSLEDALRANDLLLADINKVVSYDLVEYNPLRDKNNETQVICNKLLNQLFKAIEKKL